MPSYLPAELERFIDPASTFATVRNLTAAAEAGEIGLSALTAYVRAVERGEAIRFSKTRSVPLAMMEMIERRKDLHPRQVVYLGLNEGLWEYEDVEAWENNQTVLSDARQKRTATRGVYLTRGRRKVSIRPKTKGMFVPKMSLDALCSFDVSDGAKACLGILMSLAGKEDTFTTYTVSVARRMGRTARTVRNHFIALEAAGLIVRTPGRDPNTVRITITDECRPSPYREPDDVKAYKLARRSGNPALQLLAFSAASAAMEAFPAEFRLPEGRKGISAFNPESISFLLQAPSSDAGSSRLARRQHLGPTTYSNFQRPKPSPSFHRIKPISPDGRISAGATTCLFPAGRDPSHVGNHGGYQL
jgi:hypothetical protein